MSDNQINELNDIFTKLSTNDTIINKNDTIINKNNNILNKNDNILNTSELNNTLDNNTTVDSSIITKFKDIIDINDYIKKSISDKIKSDSSLSSLINPIYLLSKSDNKLGQGDFIKLGNALEKILNIFITKFSPNIINIKKPNIKHEKEKDHLYIDHNKKIIFYAEVKSNLEMDTEKIPATINKVKQISEDQKKDYPEYTIKWFLVAARYYSSSIIPSSILKKYTSISSNLVGINEYFTELNIDEKFSNEDEYKIFINYLTKKMFKLV